MLIFAVRLILEDSNKKLLFLRQTKKNGGRYSLIGGTVESHEFAREALVREAHEEAAIHVEAKDLELVHVQHRHKLNKGESYLVLYFKTIKFYGEPASREPKKFKTTEWLSDEDIDDAGISPNTVHVLNAMKKGEIYTEFPERNKILAFWERFGPPAEKTE